MMPRSLDRFMLTALFLVAGIACAAARNAATAATAADCVQTPRAVPADTLVSDRPILLFFTAAWCGPCKLVMSDTFQNTEVAALLRRIDLRLVDIDRPQGKTLRGKYGTVRGGVPELVLLDRSGRRIGSHTGYRKDPQATLDLLRQAFAEDTLSLPEPEALPAPAVSETTQQLMQEFSQMRIPFLVRLQYSAWTLNFEAGAVFSQIASSDFDRMRTGYYVAVGTSRYCSRRWEFETGLSFSSLGGKSENDVLRSYYLTLPAEMQCRVADFGLFGIGVDVLLAGGLYGACLAGSSGSAETTPKRWDAGARARLILEAGTFRLSAGYTRGFIHCLSGEGYNQSFTVGLTLSLGK